MVQVVKQTHEEKLKMYMKLSKKELSEMLIESNKCLDTKFTIKGSDIILSRKAFYKGLIKTSTMKP